MPIWPIFPVMPSGRRRWSGWKRCGPAIEQRVDYSIDVLGVKMMGAPNQAWADYGRQKTGRTMPV
jgi:hypothetical protein